LTTRSTVSLESGAGTIALSQQAGSSVNATDRARVTISYEEEDEPYTAVPASSKILKINVDLMLWRCRQARLKAAITTDKEERKQLLKQSEEGLRRCLTLDSSDARTYVVLGKTLMLQKRYEEARQLYNNGTVNTGNTSAYIWSAWGWLEFRTGNIARARKLFDAAVVVDETHACAWHKWGMLEKSQGNYLRARDLWMQGIQKCRRKSQSQNAYLYNALAVMAAELGRVEEARAWFEEGTRTLEGAASVALWQAWAVLEAKQGDPTAVRFLFKKALVANPRSRYVHLAWALWERKQGNIDVGQQLLQRGQAMNPTDPAIYQAWGILEKEQGNYERATELFESGLKADPSHVPLWQAWGYMEFQRGNYDRARELFQQGAWADPRSRDTVYVFHTWGVLERSLGNIALARELFKAAIKVDPKNEKVWSTWIGMEQEQGNLERADELRIRRAEQQWEFEVPANFTTRPGDSSPLSGLIDTLSRFFNLRESSSGTNTRGPATPTAISSSEDALSQQDRVSGAAAGPVMSGEAGSTASFAATTRRPLRELLPEDFEEVELGAVLGGLPLPPLATPPVPSAFSMSPSGSGRNRQEATTAAAAGDETDGKGAVWQQQQQQQQTGSVRRPVRAGRSLRALGSAEEEGPGSQP